MNRNWGIWMMTAFVVGNMVGSGIFMLPGTLVQQSSPLAILLAWLVTGLGALMIALVFGNLSVRRPDLTAGPQSYARALFSSPRAGNVAGYSMVWGYWVANWAGNVAMITTFAGYLSAFFPIMKENTVLFSIGSFSVEKGKFVTFLVCSALLWGFHTLLVRGLNGAGKLSFLSTATKVLGFALFIVVCLFAFDSTHMGPFFTPVPSSDGILLGLGEQTNQAMLATMWAFIGIESAVVLSGRARSQRDVRMATIFGLAVSLVIYVGITFLTMGVLPLEQLKSSDKPLVDALSVLLGSGGSTIMATLAIISLIGSTIGWIMLGAEPPYQAARSGMFPAFFAKSNRHGSPVHSLTVTNIMSQLFIFSTLSGTISEAFTFVITIATLANLLPYLVSALYQCKLAVSGQTYEGQSGNRLFDGIVGLVTILFSLWLIKQGCPTSKPSCSVWACTSSACSFIRSCSQRRSRLLKRLSRSLTHRNDRQGG